MQIYFWSSNSFQACESLLSMPPKIGKHANLFLVFKFVSGVRVVAQHATKNRKTCKFIFGLQIRFRRASRCSACHQKSENMQIYFWSSNSFQACESLLSMPPKIGKHA